MRGKNIPQPQFTSHPSTHPLLRSSRVNKNVNYFPTRKRNKGIERLHLKIKKE